MTLARIALAVSAVFLAFMVGLATAPAPVRTVQPAHALRVADLRLDAPGPIAAAAATSVEGPAAPASGRAATNHAAVVGSPPPPPPPPAPPAPPPPEVMLRSATAAVTEEGGRLGLVLAGGSGRRLHAGDSFMGWRIASVTRSGAVMTRGRERREATFFGPAASDRDLAPPLSADATRGRPPAPASPAPTSAEYFRGFKG